MTYEVLVKYECLHIVTHYYTLEKTERLQDKNVVSIKLDKSCSDDVMWTKSTWAVEKVMDQSISVLVKSLL